MDIKPRKPQNAFDFGVATTLPFRSAGGQGFVLRLTGAMAVLLTLLYLVVIPMIAPLYGDLLDANWQNMQAILSGSTPPNTDALMALFLQMLPAYAVMLLGMWLILAAGEAALHRKFLRAEEAAKTPLRIGGDELRVMLAQLGVWAMVFVVYLLGVVLLTLIAGALAAAVPILGAILGAIGAVVLVAALIFIPVRLAPAAALSVERRKRHFLAANKITKHRFLWLFLAYMVVGVGGYVAIYAIGALCIGIATGDLGFITALSGLGSESPLIAYDLAAERFGNPVFYLLGAVCLAVYSFVFCLWYLCLAGIGTYAVSWWQAENPISQFD